MTNKEFNQLLSDIYGSALKKYPVFVRMEREACWPGCLEDFTRSISDLTETDEDRQYQSLAKLYSESTEAQREVVRSVCRECYSVLFFATRIAIRALRGGGQGTLELAIIAIVMEDVAFDFRESMLTLTMIRGAAERHNLDIAGAVKRASEMATPATAEFLLQFMQRPMEGLIHSMGLVEICDENGPVLAFRPF